MALQDVFNYHKDHNPDGYFAEKVNDNVLYTRFSHNGSTRQYAYYDFLSQTVSFLVTNSNTDRTVTFGEMSRDALELHREKLIQLGGHPQPLPGATGVMNKPALSPFNP